MDGSEVLIVNGRYLCPDISRDFVNDYMQEILDGFLDNR
jgi:hypothetical protein